MFSVFLYSSWLTDVLVTSTKVSAYYLVCTRMVLEMALFLFTHGEVLLTVSNALRCPEHKSEHFTNVPNGIFALFQMTLAMFGLNVCAILAEGALCLRCSAFSCFLRASSSSTH